MYLTFDQANLPLEIALKKYLHMNRNMYNGPSIKTEIRQAKYNPEVFSGGCVKGCSPPAWWRTGQPRQPDRCHSVTQKAKLLSGEKGNHRQYEPTYQKTHPQTTCVYTDNTYVGKCTEWMWAETHQTKLCVNSGALQGKEFIGKKRFSYFCLFAFILFEFFTWWIHPLFTSVIKG